MHIKHNLTHGFSVCMHYHINILSLGPPSAWQTQDWEIYAGKIMNIHWLANTQLLTTGPEGEIVSIKYICIGIVNL